MPSETDDIQRINPDRLVHGFRRIDLFLIGLALAVGIHVAVIGGTSVSYVLDQLDPSRVEARKAELAARKKADEAEKARAGTPAEKDAGAPEGGPADEPAAGGGDQPSSPAANVPEHLKDHPVVREVTEAADPDEIPDAPDDLGISLDETNTEE